MNTPEEPHIAKIEQGMIMHTIPEVEKQLKRLNELLEFYLKEAYGYKDVKRP